MKQNSTSRLWAELAISGVAGLVCAFSMTPSQMSRIDEMMVTFMSIVLAAVIPGIALTASVARPPVNTPLEARRFGSRLSKQVEFWFGFLWTGGLAVATVVTGRALEWKLVTPRSEFVPEWMPEGYAWLIFAAVAAVVFVAVRARHVVTAVQSLINVGTELHAEQVGARAREVQKEVRDQIAAIPPDATRGALIEDRPRH